MGLVHKDIIERQQKPQRQGMRCQIAQILAPVFVVIDRMYDHEKYFLFLTIRTYAKGA